MKNTRLYAWIFRIAMVQEGNIEKWATISFAEFDKKFGISRTHHGRQLKKRRGKE
jgi:hypothetical protein